MSTTAGNPLGQMAANMGERPRYKIKMGNVPDIVAQNYFRSDTPDGRAHPPPSPEIQMEARTMFRQLLASGWLEPENDAARAMAVSEGGIQEGQMSLFGVPFIEGLAGGMTAEEWNALTQRAQEAWNERREAAELSGVFEGKSTLERERIEAEIKRDIFQNETERYRVEQNVRTTDKDLDRLELERQDARRAGDLDREQALTIEIDRQLLKRQEMTGWIGGEGGTGAGGQATLGREQQAFDQAVAAAELAANPRTGLQAWMLGQRGGLNGQPAVNFVPPSTTAPGQAPVAPVNQFTPPAGMTTTAGQRSGAAAPAPGAPAAFGFGAAPTPSAFGFSAPGAPTSGLRGSDSLANAAQAGAAPSPAPEKKEPSLLAGGGGGFAYPLGTGGGEADGAVQDPAWDQWMQWWQSPQAQQMMQQRQMAQAAQQGNSLIAGDYGLDQTAGNELGGPNQGQQPGMVYAQPASAFGAAQQQTTQNASPQATPTGQMLPTTSFTESLMQGNAVPNQGNLQTQGAWWAADQFQQKVNPAKWRVQDYMRGTEDEKQGALGAASFGGFSDQTTQDLLKKQLPSFRAPSSSSLA